MERLRSRPTALFLCAGLGAMLAAAAAASTAAGPFDGLPTAKPGALPGRIVYVARVGCRLREYELATGTDRLLSDHTFCPGAIPVVAPDGSAVATRATNGTVLLIKADGTRLTIGSALPHGKPPGAAVPVPTFLQNGRRLAYCTGTRTAMHMDVADTATGRRLSTVQGTCQVAFTSRGPAAVRGHAVVIGGRTIYRFPDAIPANTSPGSGNPALGNTLAASPDGSLLAVVTRPSHAPGTIVVQVLRPDGRRVARSTGASRIAVSFQALAPKGTSAVVWWGDILQLAPLHVAPGRLALRYHSNGGASSESALWPVAYDPTGAYAVMPRQPSGLMSPEEPPPAQPVPAVVFDARTLKPLYGLPIDAQAAVWAAS
jgi:hypothetical protein